jgi:hypothetical protein
MYQRYVFYRPTRHGFGFAGGVRGAMGNVAGHLRDVRPARRGRG